MVHFCHGKQRFLVGTRRAVSFLLASGKMTISSRLSDHRFILTSIFMAVALFSKADASSAWSRKGRISPKLVHADSELGQLRHRRQAPACERHNYVDINCTTSSQDVNFTLSVENCSSGQIEEIFPGPHDAYKIRFIRDTGLFRLDAPDRLERAMKIIVCELPDGQHGRKRGRSFRIQSIFSLCEIVEAECPAKADPDFTPSPNSPITSSLHSYIKRMTTKFSVYVGIAAGFAILLGIGAAILLRSRKVMIERRRRRIERRRPDGNFSERQQNDLREDAVLQIIPPLVGISPPQVIYSAQHPVQPGSDQVLANDVQPVQNTEPHCMEQPQRPQGRGSPSGLEPKQDTPVPSPSQRRRSFEGGVMTSLRRQGVRLSQISHHSRRMSAGGSSTSSAEVPEDLRFLLDAGASSPQGAMPRNDTEVYPYALSARTSMHDQENELGNDEGCNPSLRQGSSRASVRRHSSAPHSYAHLTRRKD